MPLDRSIPHATVYTNREARFSLIRTALTRGPKGRPPDICGGSEGSSTTLGNGNGATPTVLP